MGLFDDTEKIAKEAARCAVHGLMYEDRRVIRRYIWGKLTEPARAKLLRASRSKELESLRGFLRGAPSGEEIYLSGGTCLRGIRELPWGTPTMQVKPAGLGKWLTEEQFLSWAPQTKCEDWSWLVEGLPDHPLLAALRAQEIIDELNNNA